MDFYLYIYIHAFFFILCLIFLTLLIKKVTEKEKAFNDLLKENEDLKLTISVNDMCIKELQDELRKGDKTKND